MNTILTYLIIFNMIWKVKFPKLFQHFEYLYKQVSPEIEVRVFHNQLTSGIGLEEFGTLRNSERQEPKTGSPALPDFRLSRQAALFKVQLSRKDREGSEVSASTKVE